MAARLPDVGPSASRWTGGVVVASGVVTMAIWLMDPAGSRLAGDPPKRPDHVHDLFTHAFDLGVIVPAAYDRGLGGR